MDDLSQYIIVFELLVEVAILTYLEVKAWKSLYTPLCALMIPYVLVLLITIPIAGDYGFVPLNYDSIYIWMYGLPLFAIPSFICSTVLQYCGQPVVGTIKEEEDDGLSPALTVIACILVALLLFKLQQTLTHGFYMFGTEDFADEFSGRGVWPHLREMLMPILILALYYVRKKQYLLWALIFFMLLIQFSYMVKGAIIIAAVSALFMRLYTGKMRMSLTLILSVIIGAALIFIIVYMVVPLLGNESGEANMELVEFIGRHFLHYFTSGTLGWSYDIDQGMPDVNEFSIIVSPFLNLYNFVAGDELLSPVNPFYLNTGINLTNVRTFFGTLSIYTDFSMFAAYTLIASSALYAMRMAALYTRDVYIYCIHFYFCGLMAMGWFEFYLFHLSIIEIPLITLFYAWLARHTADWRRRRQTAQGKEVALG